VPTINKQKQKFTNPKNLRIMSNWKVLGATFLTTVLAVITAVKVQDYLKKKSA